MTRTKAKAKAQGPSAEGRMPPHPSAEGEDCLYRGVKALIADVARERPLTVIEVVGVLTAVTHDVLAGVWMLAREQEQRRKAQAGEEKA